MAYKRAATWQDAASIARSAPVGSPAAKRRAVADEAHPAERHVTFSGADAPPSHRGVVALYGDDDAGDHTAHAHQRNKFSIAHRSEGRVSVASARWKTKLFNGVYAAVVTPLHADGSVAPELIDAYAQQLKKDGVNGVFACGTAGMSMSLSVRERKTLVEAWCAAGLRHDLEVLAHIGAQSVEESKALAAHAEEAGVLAVACMAPSFFKPSSAEELAAYCSEVAAAAAYTPFLYYHSPDVTGVTVSMRDAMAAMHQTIPTLRGGKFASKDVWDLGDTLDLGEKLGVQWDLMMGYEGMTTSVLPLGVTAHVGVAFNVLAPVWIRMIRAFDGGRQDEACVEQAIGRAWFRMFAGVGGGGSAAAVVKVLLAQRIGGGIDFGTTRVPQKPLSSEECVSLLTAWSAFLKEHPQLLSNPGPLILGANAKNGKAAPAANGAKASPAADKPVVLDPRKIEARAHERCKVMARHLSIDLKDVLTVLPHLGGLGSARPVPQESSMDVRDAIDHTLLKADASFKEVAELCSEARKHRFFAVCVNSSRVRQCVEAVRGSDVKVAAVVGFPLGAAVASVKVAETQQAVADGADEIDMVLNIGMLKEGNYDGVYEDIAGVVEASRGKAIVKVIFETCLLTPEQIIDASILSALASADYVKTSTGFSKSGASVEAVQLMKTTVGDACLVKASGGIRDLPTARKYLNFGVSRIGTSSGVAIVSGSAGTTGY